MGMAASQARLLSITARLSNNEQAQQTIAYTKQRLAENSEQANDAYLEALSKTKYQVLTGYNANQANFADLTYAQITGLSSVACGKQYLAKFRTGQVLVTDQVAKAFRENNGDYNKFLRDLGLTESDLDMTKPKSVTEQAVHEAWDRYLYSVNKGIYDKDGKTSSSKEYDGQHILDFGYTKFSSEAFDGYPTFKTATAVPASDSNAVPTPIYINTNGDYYKERTLIKTFKDEQGNTQVGYQTFDSEGNTVNHVLDNITYDEEKAQFVYKDVNNNEVYANSLYIDEDDMSISENKNNVLTFDKDANVYKSEGNKTYNVTEKTSALNYEGTTQEQRELYDYALSLTVAFYDNDSVKDLKYDKELLTYYKNIFTEMRKCGYTTLEESYKQKLQTTTSGEYMTSESKIFNDPDWMVKQLKSGNIILSYYSAAEKGFVSTTIDDDESIVEKEDKAAIALAEQAYKKQMDVIEHQDKQFDLQLNKLESEHNALQTEYDSVKKVISTNVEKSFGTFNA